MSSNEFVVGVKLQADDSQYTATFTHAGQTAQAFTAQLTGAGQQASAGLQAVAAEAGKMGASVATSGQTAATGLGATASAAQAAGTALQTAGAQGRQGLESITQASRSVRTEQSQADAVGQQFLRTLREQIATSGKSAEELLRYRAAQSGVAQEASHLILQWQNQKAAQLAAAEAAQKEEAAQREAAASKRSAQAAADSFIQGLRDQAATQGLSAAELLRYRAAQLGVSESAAPYLRALDDANKANGRGAISAGQHAAAMRMLPAQMTDVVTSIASGMPIWMVAIQQGGQVKDSFGGAANAARAVLGAITPLAAGLGTLAIGIGATVAAYYQGSAEADRYRQSIVLSGNAAAVTVEQLSRMAREVDKITGTQADAAAGLALMARSNKIGSDSFVEFTAMAVAMKDSAGKAVADTVKELEDLGKKPADASAKLNEQYNYLTPTIYRQIKALEDQGRTEEAAALAQKTYSKAMSERAQQLDSELGYVERGWKAAKDAAADAWDKFLNIGRPTTVADKADEQIKYLEAEIKRRKEQNASLNIKDGKATADLEKQLETAKGLSQMSLSAGKAIADAVDKENKARQTGIDLQREAASHATKAEKRARELAEAEGKYGEHAKTSAQARLDYERLIAGIKDKYKDPKSSAAGQVSITDTQIAGLRSQLQAAELYGEQLRTMGTAASELNAGERESLKLAEQIKLTTNAKTRAKLELAKTEADALGVQLRSNDGLEKSLKTHQAVIDATNKDATSIEARAREQEAANTVIGKGRTAIEQMTLATLENQMVEAQRSDRFDPLYIEGLERKIDAQKRYVDALGQADYQAVIAHADELLRNANELARAYDDELALSGLTGLEREKIVAQRQVELKYAKEIAAIDNSSLTDSEKRRAKEKVYEAQRIEASAAGAKAQQTYMGKASDEINRNLTDALMRGFENGKTALENLADTTKNVWNTMVLRPVISAIMTPVSTVTNSVIQSGLNAIGLGGGGNNLLSTASNASSLYSLTTGNSLVGQVANWLGLGSAAATAGAATGIAAGVGSGLTLASSSAGLGLTGAAGTGFSLAAGGGLGLTAGSAGAGAIGAGLGSSAAAAGGTAAAGAGGLTGALAAIPGWGWALGGLAALGLSGTFSSRGANHSGGAYSTASTDRNTAASQALATDAWGNALSDITQRGNTEIDKKVGETVNALSEVYKSLSQFATGAREIDIAAAFAVNGKHGDEDRYGYYSIIDKVSGEAFASYKNRALGNDDAAAYTKFATDLANGVFSQLRSSGLEKWVDDTLAKLGDAPSLEALATAVAQITAAHAALTQFGLAMPQFAAQSAAARAALMDQAGGSQALVERLGSFYSNYFTEAERTAVATQQVTEQLQALGYAMPASRDEYRAWVTTAIDAGESGAKSAAGLLKLESAVAGLLPATKDAATVAAEAAKALRSAADISNKEQDLQIQLLRAQGSELAAVALERQRELSALEEYGSKAVAIQQQIWALQDHALERSERSLRLQRQQEARATAEEIVNAQREAFRGLGKSLADEALRAGGGMIGSLAVSAAEAESAGQFKEFLDGATASLAEIEKLGLTDQLSAYTAEIGKLIQATKQAMADQVASSRLLAGNARSAISALMSASTLNYSQFTSGGNFNAGAFNSAVAKERAGMAGSLIADASINALQVQNAGGVLAQLGSVIEEAREYVSRDMWSSVAQTFGETASSSLVQALGSSVDTLVAREMQKYRPSAPGLAAISNAQHAYAQASARETVDGKLVVGSDAIAYSKSVSRLNGELREGTVSAQQYGEAVRWLDELYNASSEGFGVLSAQMARAGSAALDVARAGFEGLDHYFKSITASADALDAQARQSGSPLGQVADGIGRMQSAATAFGASAGAVLSGLQSAADEFASASEQAIVDARGVVAGSEAWFGFYDASARYAAQSDAARLGLADQMNTEGSKLRKGTLASEAAQIAAQVMTTASAAEFAKQIKQSGAFSAADATGIRDASLLLDGVRANDATAFESAYARLTAALNKGTLTEAQYIELMNLGLRTLSGEQVELEKRSSDLTNAITRLRDAVKSTADALLLSETESTLSGEQIAAEARRQYAQVVERLRADPTDSQAVSEIAAASKAMLAAAQNVSTAAEYSTLFAETIRDLRVFEALQVPASALQSSTPALKAPTFEAASALQSGTPAIKVPAFDVGTNYLPSDMLALVHAGERIIPAADNRQLMQALASGGSPEVVGLLRQIVERLEQLEISNLNGHHANEIANNKSAESLQQIVAEGVRPYQEEPSA